MNHKSFSAPIFNIKATDNSRIITGIAAVIGNIDSGKDIVAPGAFRKAILAFKAGRSRARFLWNHDGRQPPIAKILDLKEIGRDQLPPEVLAKDPTAQGGLVVKRQYFKDAFADRVYQGIMSGAIGEMSFAYDVLKSSEQLGRNGGSTVRLLEELDLFDLSDVNWGMNAATVAAGAKGGRHSRCNLSPTIRAKINTLNRFIDTLPPTDSERLKQRAANFLFSCAKSAALEILDRPRVQRARR